jgi:DnaK suppressor protein
VTGEQRDSGRTVLRADRSQTARRLAGLERDFDHLVESVRHANADDEHDPEGATLAFEREHLAALIDQARKRLSAIDLALNRIDEGSYGRCERCGDPIGADRLAARPAATTCVACAARKLAVLRLVPTAKARTADPGRSTRTAGPARRQQARRRFRRDGTWQKPPS